MKNERAPAIFESLSPGVRLDLFRLLVKQGEVGLVAGEISAALGVPPSNLSFHLKSLVHAGLLSVQQEGRFERYRANIPLMMDVIDYLTNECCAGYPEQCMDLRAASTSSAGVSLPTAKRKRVACVLTSGRWQLPRVPPIAKELKMKFLDQPLRFLFCAVRNQHADRYALVPLLPDGPVGVERLLQLCGHSIVQADVASTRELA